MTKSLWLLPSILILASRGEAAQPILPLPEADVLHRLQYENFSILSVKAAGGGVMGAKKIALRFDDGNVINVKWKEASSIGDTWNNSPRREIGVYVAQTLFLDPQDYLVPPVTVRCIALADYTAVVAKPTPSPGLNCVFGSFSAWFENVQQPDRPYDSDRFASDPRYAYHVANLNLLHYLVDHRDARANNFLVPKDPDDARVLSIDNGIAFGGVLYNFFMRHLNEIRVPALPRQSVARLRAIRHEDLLRLGVLGQLTADSAGVLPNIAPTANLDPEIGTRVTAAGLQFGLTRQEIDGMEERLKALLARIDAGEVQSF